MEAIPTFSAYLASESSALATLPAVLRGKHCVVEFSGCPSALDRAASIIDHEGNGWEWQRSSEEGGVLRLTAWRPERREETALFVHLALELHTTLEAFVANTLADSRYDCFRFVGPAGTVKDASLYIPRFKYNFIVLPYDCLQDGWCQLCVTRLPASLEAPSCAARLLSEVVSKMTLPSSLDQ